MKGDIQQAYTPRDDTSTIYKQSIRGYELLRVLGEGAFGTVFFAKQLSTDQFVAVKLLKLDKTLNGLECERQIKRFEKETRLCAGLHHPNIVRLLDKGQISGKKMFAVFEYIPGETLKDFLRREGALPAPVAAELMAQLLDAMAAAHRVGVVHRDLKPGNIMVTKTGSRLHLKILDYGIGTFVSNQIQDKTFALTLTHETIGTPSYSSPEQLRGEPSTVKSDIYSWGLLLLECLTGQVVMQGVSLAEIFHKQLSPQDVPLPPAIVGHELGNLLRRVLQKNPQQRAGQAEQLYRTFIAINFNEIVGRIDSVEQAAMTTAMTITRTCKLEAGSAALAAERRNITVLACKIYISNVSDKLIDTETMDALQTNELAHCIDIALRYGAYQAGGLGDALLFYYGYPYISDTDARRAARTALELVSNIQRRNSLLKIQQGVEFEMQFGLHSGLVVCKRGQMPSGVTANIALQLMQKANPGQILASEPIKHLLRQHADFNQATSLTYPGESQTRPCYNLLEEKYTEAYVLDSAVQSNVGMVGRLVELNYLRQHWRLAMQGAGGSVLLLGEAGIGKSCLCRALKNEAYAVDVGVYEVRCLPEQQNRALYPILELLKHRFGFSEEDTVCKKVIKLETVLKKVGSPIDVALPVLCAWFSLPLPEKYSLSHLTPKEQKKIMLSVAGKIVTGLAAQQPCLLVLEDLHWSDPTTLEFLQKLINALSASALLVVLSARPRPQFLLPEELSLDRTIVLNPLSDKEVEALIDSTLGSRPISAEALSQILDRTGGVPLFVQELMRMLLDQEVLIFCNGGYTLESTLDSCQIPITLLDLLSERLSSAGVDKEIAQLAAAIGRESQGSLLARVAGCDKGEIQLRLENLIGAGLLYKQRSVGETMYSFRHILIRDAAYESIPIKARIGIHYRIAEAIEASSLQEKECDFSLLARHWSNAKVKDKAIENFLKAGQRAASLYAHYEALENFKYALLEAETVEDHQRCQVINALHGQALECFADVSIALAQHEQGRDALQACFEYVNSEDMIMLARLHRKMGKSWETHHHCDKALHHYQSAAEGLLRDERQKSSACWLQEWLEVSKAQLYVHYWRNDVASMGRVLAQAQPIIKERATPLQQAGFLDDVLHLLLRQTRFRLDSAGVAVAYDALNAAKASKDPMVLLWAQFMLGLALLFNDALSRAEKEMQVAVLMAKKLNDVTLLARGLTYLTIILRRRKKVDEVKACCNEALTVSEQVGMHDYIATAKANMAWHALKTGNQIKAVALAIEAQEIWEQLADSYPYPMQWLGAIVLAAVNFKKGNLNEVTQYAEKIIADDQTKLNDQFHEKLSSAISQLAKYKCGTIPFKLKKQMLIIYSSAFDQALALGYL